MKSLAVAMGCLTILPFGPRGSIRDAEFGGSWSWFPIVGLMIGGLLLVVEQISSRIFPPTVVASFILLAWIILTGALHLDGLGDFCDGLAGGRTSEERLRIMKDPHVGAMAVVAIGLVLLIKQGVLSSLSFQNLSQALLLTPCLGRFAIVAVGTTLPYARSAEGTAAPFVRHANRWALGRAAAVTLVTCILLKGFTGLGLLGISLLAAWIIRGMAKKLLGGVTGDVLGATCEIVEAGVLAGCLMF